MDWALREGLIEKLKGEKGYYIYPRGTRTSFALIYPNSYYLGMSNLGLHIIYALLNKREDTFCERAFLPERAELKRYEATRTPIMSVETQTPLYDFSLLGFVVSFEMDYFNILKILELGKVKLKASERGERDPIVIAGGPCATFNPEPLSSLFDAFIIGEGEVIMPAFMDAYHEARRAGLSREETLRTLAQVPGVYVPSLYRHEYDAAGRLSAIVPLAGAPAKVYRQWVRELDEYPAHTEILTESTEFNFYLIETARGCGRHCRFCMAGYAFRKPRNRSLSVINEEVEAALPYKKRLGLMGAAISDYPEIDELCRSILGEGLSMSVASFRADSVTEELVASLASSGLKTLTIAPEAGSPRMRAVINKGITEEHVFNTMRLGLRAGIYNFKLYFMVGLPFEEEEDIDAIIDLALRLKDFMEADGAKGKNGTLTLSINPFVPKPFTPFMWLPMAEKKTVDKRLKRIEQTLRKRRHLAVNAESTKEAYLQGILARGDRRVGEALLLSGGDGRTAFRRALKELSLDEKEILYREREEAELFPWDVLDLGFRRSYLFAELKKARAGLATPQCFEGCRRCGVCDDTCKG